MRYKNLFSSGRAKPSQGYFKEGVELLYPAQDHPIKIALLPAYDPLRPDDPTGWVPAVTDREQMVESDFYTIVRSAKFVGHGSKSNRVSFVSPQTFDENAVDPYAALYDYCLASDEWSYLTKKGGKSLSGDYEGPVIPAPQDRFVANAIDLSLGERGGVFVVELGETITRQFLYENKDGEIKRGFLFGDESEKFGDITVPGAALGFIVSWGSRGYSIKPLKDGKDDVLVSIPETLLQHRRHMEAPETFINAPGSAQEIVDRLAKILTGYKSPSGRDESYALMEAMDKTFGKGTYKVAVPEEKVRKMSPDMQALMKKQGFIKEKEPERKKEPQKPACKPASKKQEKVKVEVNAALASVSEAIPGEKVDLSDIVALRAQLAGGK